MHQHQGDHAYDDAITDAEVLALIGALEKARAPAEPTDDEIQAFIEFAGDVRTDVWMLNAIVAGTSIPVPVGYEEFDFHMIGATPVESALSIDEQIDLGLSLGEVPAEFQGQYTDDFDWIDVAESERLRIASEMIGHVFPDMSEERIREWVAVVRAWANLTRDKEDLVEFIIGFDLADDVHCAAVDRRSRP